MATTIQQGNINFTYDETKSVGAGLGGIFTHSGQKVNGKYVFSDRAPKVLMALDIDWNGAKPGIGEGTNGITTTGELVKEVYSPMFAKAA